MMVNQVRLWLLVAASSLVAVAFGSEEAFFTSSSIMEVEWEAEAGTEILSLQEINSFEDSISVLLHTSMKTESESTTGLFPDQTILATDIHIKNVTQNNNGKFRLKAIVDVLYLAEAPVADMATMLIRLSRKPTVEETLVNDIYDILGGSAESVVINYKTLQTTTKLWELENAHNGNKKADKSLILACTLLCAALVLVTSVLLYVAGGWRDLREKLEEQMDWFKEHRRTQSMDEDEESGGVDVADSQSYDEDDDDAATNPSGVLGANSQESEDDDEPQNAAAGLGINATPERGMDDDGYQTTPFSEMSKYSEASARRPLGIQSMRKMQLPGREEKFMSLPPLSYQ